MKRGGRKPASPSPTHSGATATKSRRSGGRASSSNNDLFLFVGLSRYVSPASQRLGGLSPLGGLLRQRGRLKASHGMWPVTHYHGAVEHFMHRHRATGQGMAPACFPDLIHPMVEHYRVVLVHTALVLDREHPIQILAPGPHKRVTHLLRRNRKSPVKLIHILRPKKLVGCFDRNNAAQAQFLRKTSLPGPVTALHPAPRLRRIGWDHLNP